MADTGIRTSNLPRGVPLELLGHSDTGSLVRGSLDEVVNAIRDLVASDPSGVATLSGRLSDLSNALNSKASTTVVQSVLDALTQARAVAESVGERPGDRPELFTSSLAGGEASTLPDLALPIVTADAGRVIRVSGETVVARKGVIRIEDGRTYAFRYAAQRRTDPDDPENDAVQFAVLCLDQGKQVLAAAPFLNAATIAPRVSDWRQDITVLASLAGGNGILKLPAGTKHARAYVKAYGGPHRTDIEIVAQGDVTDAALYSPDVSAFVSRLNAFDSQNLDPRLVAVEGAIANPKSVTIATRQGASALPANTVPASATIVQTLGYYQAGDGGGGRYEYRASPPAGAEAITIGSRTFVLVETNPSILQFGGADDGATNIVPILDRVRATYPGTDAITVQFPLRLQGVYFFASPADFSRIIVAPADKLTFSATIQPPTIFRTLAPVYFYFRSLKYGYVISPEALAKAPIQKRGYVRRADVMRKRPRIIDPTGADLTHAYVSHPNGDTWTGGVVPTSRDANGVAWQTGADSNWYGSFVPAVPSEELHAFFPSGENFLRAVIVRCTAGYQIVYIRQDGSAVFRSKAIGAAATESAITWQAMASMPVYSGVFADLAISVINQRRWTLRVSGVDALNGVDGLGHIEWIGYGTLGTGGIVAPIYGWNRYRGGDMAGTQSQRLLVIGDSRSEALAGSWPQLALEILDRSLGMRWTAVDNRAVGGETSAQQLARLQSVGTGEATVATVGLGTNDIQQGVPVGAVGTAGSYIDNLSKIFAILRAAAVKIAFVLPMVWYEQSMVQQAVGEIRGQGAQQSGSGALYRQAAMRLCNGLGIPVVDTLQGHGIVDVGFLNRNAFDLDPTLRDNIHQTGAAYADEAVWIAEAIASLVVPNPTRAMESQPLSASFLRAGWSLPAEIYLPHFSRSEGGVVELAGLIQAGTKDGGTVVMQLPRFLWPRRTRNFPVLQIGAASRDCGRIQIGADGQCVLYMSDTSAGLISLDDISYATD